MFFKRVKDFMRFSPSNLQISRLDDSWENSCAESFLFWVFITVGPLLTDASLFVWWLCWSSFVFKFDHRTWWISSLGWIEMSKSLCVVVGPSVVGKENIQSLICIRFLKISFDWQSAAFIHSLVQSWTFFRLVDSQNRKFSHRKTVGPKNKQQKSINKPSMSFTFDLESRLNWKPVWHIRVCIFFAPL